MRLEKIYTGTWNTPGSYKIVYRTNLSGDTWRTLADNLSTSKNYVLDASPTALGLASNEYVTEFMAAFGIVPANFRQVEAPRVDCKALAKLTGGTQFVMVRCVSPTIKISLSRSSITIINALNYK